MNDQKHIQVIIDFLNLKADSPFPVAKRVLQESMLCRYILSFSGSDKKFSLLTREEVADIQDDREASRISLGTLRSEIAPIDDTKTRSLFGALMTRKEGIIFPEDNDETSGMRGQDLLMRELFAAVEWFQAFMAGCESGRMDVGTLNQFKYTKGIVMEFKPSKNAMNPALSAAELFDTGDDIIERKILCNLIYPFLFSGQGVELSKIRRCRNCNIYFLGKRVSATFCNSKCRNTFYYEHST